VPEAEIEHRVNVIRYSARKTPELRAQAVGHDHLYRATVVIRDARKADFNSVNTERVDETRDLELLVRPEDDADRLFSVSEGRVVQAYKPPISRPEGVAV
jgi:hypothetical protein